MRFSPVLPAALIALAAQASAQNAQPMEIKVEVFAVKTVTLPNGTKRNEFVKPDLAPPGMPLVIAVRYISKTAKPVNGFKIDYPVPNGIRYTGLGPNSEWGTVSVDGGKSFGGLSTLKVKTPQGTLRPASVDDVTNVRWLFTRPITAGQTGTVMAYAQIR